MHAYSVIEEILLSWLSYSQQFEYLLMGFFRVVKMVSVPPFDTLIQVGVDLVITI